MIHLKDKDTYAKKYMSDNNVFADAFNFLIYDGEEVIKPERLKPLDTSVLAVPFGYTDKKEPVQKIRDLLKLAEIKKDDENIYLILGVENQSEIHYAMPVRNMLYDVLEYTRQVESMAKAHREAKDYKGISAGEFLSGFYKDDRLIPVITLVIYFGADKWNAPRSIYDMFEIKDKRILSFVTDYHINLIAPYELDGEKAERLHSNLKEVLLYIKNSNDKEKLRDLVQSDKKFSRLERDAVDIINVFTNSKLKINDNQEVVDVCKALLDIKEEGRLEGRLEGIIPVIEMCKEFKVSYSDTIKRVSLKFKLTEEEAETKVKEIW